MLHFQPYSIVKYETLPKASQLSTPCARIGTCGKGRIAIRCQGKVLEFLKAILAENQYGSLWELVFPFVKYFLAKLPLLVKYSCNSRLSESGRFNAFSRSASMFSHKSEEMSSALVNYWNFLVFTQGIRKTNEI